MTSRANRNLRTDQNGNRLGPRPQVGEADRATRRAALDAALNAREPAGNYSSPKRKPQSQPGGVSPNTMRLLRDRGSQIDREVKKRSY